MICPDFPYPATNGTRVDIWNRILFLHQLGWRIVLVVCWTAEVSKSGGDPSATLPIKVESYVFEQGLHNSCEVQKLVDEYKPQVVWCEYSKFVSLARALNLRGAKLWFRSHNFELAHYLEKEIDRKPWRTWKGAAIPLQALKWVENVWKAIAYLFREERQMHQIADRIFFISDSDRNVMSRLYGGRSVKDWILPFLEREAIPVKAREGRLNVLYLSSTYASLLHISGAHTLLDHIIPAVESAFPDVFQFHIVGKEAQKYLGDRATDTVTIHGFIEDLPAFLQEMDIACMPIQIGWGCKIKMIESLAYGLPVIGSPELFRGVPPTPEAYYMCRTNQDFVAAFRRLQTSENRRAMSEAAKRAYEGWLDEARTTLKCALKEVELPN